MNCEFMVDNNDDDDINLVVENVTRLLDEHIDEHRCNNWKSNSRSPVNNNNNNNIQVGNNKTIEQDGNLNVVADVKHDDDDTYDIEKAVESLLGESDQTEEQPIIVSADHTVNQSTVKTSPYCLGNHKFTPCAFDECLCVCFVESLQASMKKRKLETFVSEIETFRKLCIEKFGKRMAGKTVESIFFSVPSKSDKFMARKIIDGRCDASPRKLSNGVLKLLVKNDGLLRYQDGNWIFKIMKILDVKRNNSTNIKKYKVLWGDGSSSWIRKQDMTDTKLIDQFERRRLEV